MKAAILDAETTGLTKHPDARPEVQPRIIELGILVIDAQGTEYGEMNELVNPGEAITDEITKITGITNDDLQGLPGIGAHWDRAMNLFSKADLLIAHNLPFDLTLLELEARRLGLPLDKVPPIKFCTVAENMPLFGRRVKLTQLYEAVTGEKLAQSHRAIDDVRALAEIVLQENYIERLERNFSAPTSR